MPNIMSKLQSRKLLLTLLFTLVGTVLVLASKLSGEVFIAALTTNYGMYFGANVLAKTNPIINEDNRYSE